MNMSALQPCPKYKNSPETGAVFAVSIIFGPKI